MCFTIIQKTGSITSDKQSSKIQFLEILYLIDNAREQCIPLCNDITTMFFGILGVINSDLFFVNLLLQYL